LEDGRKCNKRPSYLTEEKLKKIKEAHQAAPEGHITNSKESKVKVQPQNY